MARLTIFTRSAQDPPELVPGDVFHLNRRFLTGADDDEQLPRLGPAIFYGADGWYVSNDTSNQTLVLWSPSGRVDMIEPGLAKKLEEGESDMQIADREVALAVEEDDADLEAPPLLPGPITEDPDKDAEDELKQVMKGKPVFRTIVYVRFQEYIPAPPHGQPRYTVRKPAPLTAADVTACYPEATEVMVNEVARRMREITGLHLWKTGDWLASRGILLSTHNIDIPHTACGHRRASQF
jgi:hypothetical protein